MATGDASGHSGHSERREPRKRRRGFRPAPGIVQAMIVAYGGSVDQAIEQLAGENHELREERRKLTEELQQLREHANTGGGTE